MSPSWATIGPRGAPNRPRPVQVRMGRATVIGDLDKNIIRRYVRRKLPPIRLCYERRLQTIPGLSGDLDIEFRIVSSGQVKGVTAKGMDGELASCVTRAIRSVRFPTTRGGIVKVRYPFIFRPPLDSEVREKGEESTMPALAKSPASAPIKKLARAELYVAGKSNPLAKVAGALATCAAKAATKHGAVVVEMTAGPDGALTSTAAHGGDDELDQCVAAAARSITLAASERPERSYRCPFAWGELEIETAPGIDITDKVVRLGGKEVARLRDVLEQLTPRVDGSSRRSPPAVGRSARTRTRSSRPPVRS